MKPSQPVDLVAALIGHLINIADLTGRSLKWNPVKEEFASCDAANRLRSRAMRAPWRIHFVTDYAS